MSAVEMRNQRSAHWLLGIDPFGDCWIATCACGWSSALHRLEDRALIAYGRHRAGVVRPLRSLPPAVRREPIVDDG